MYKLLKLYYIRNILCNIKSTVTYLCCENWKSKPNSKNFDCALSLCNAQARFE